MPSRRVPSEASESWPAAISHKNEANSANSASGLGRATAEELCRLGGHVAVLDMNEELGRELVKELGSAARFFVCDVLDTKSIATAIREAVAWAKQTGKPLGGVIPAAGVGNPATV